MKPRLMVYGPSTANVLSKAVEPDEFSMLPKLREYMVGVMRLCNGAGLAACQVGVLKNLVVLEREDGTILDLVNPEIYRMYGKELMGFEACLSIPPFGNGCLVPRLFRVDVVASTVDRPSTREMYTFVGENARCVQHEIDHLTGTYFIDRAAEIPRNKVMRKFEAWKAEWEKKNKPFPYSKEML